MTDTPLPASNPCQSGETDAGTPFTGDPSDPVEVARWRHAERNRLRTDRLKIRSDRRDAITRSLTGHLDRLLSKTDLTGRIIGAYWPIKGELDLRPWLMSLRDRGAVLALSVCERPIQAMRFRRWQPEQDMERGIWGIPVPPAASGEVTPDLMIVPLLGWDMDRYRLGFGAGYFDRTLAAADPPPYCIGIGLQSARIATIVPQPHDMRMDLIVTEAGLQAGTPPPSGALPSAPTAG